MLLFFFKANTLSCVWCQHPPLHVGLWPSFTPSHLSRLFTVLFSKLIPVMNKLTNQLVSNLNNHNQANYQFSFNLIFPSSNSTHHPDIPFLILFSLLRTSSIFIHSSTHCNLISWNSLCKCLYYFVLFDFFLIIAYGLRSQTLPLMSFSIYQSLEATL